MDPVTKNEKEFKQWKESTRREALENEVERLKSTTTGQAAKIRKMTYDLFAALAIIITFLSIFWVPSSSDKEDQTASANNKENTESIAEISSQKETMELNVISPISDTIKFQIPENGIIFSIQIGAYLSHDLQKFNDNMITLHQYSSENINQFTLGLFTNYTEALEFREIVKQIGFSDAYVTALKNGKRINIQEAIRASEETKTKDIQ
jgi:hypothetical protein